ncbi:MAG: hypothetical protein IKL68_05350 [Clostridia bacterium]|nr:hypothetical protein [Clostridia bacterium]
MKKGISLIVLVITIIVMIIIAASVVITLTNTGITNKANEAVDLTNEKQVQNLAALIWSESYLDELRGKALVDEVTDRLKGYGVTDAEWNIVIADNGITVENKNNNGGNNTQFGTGLGSLITADNYGDKVDYTVTVNGTTYDDWQIYYHNNEYIFLIAEEYVEKDVVLNKGTQVASLTEAEVALYEKFRVGDAPKYTLVDKVGSSTSNNSQAVVQLIKDYANFANTTTYGSNVEGAIGGPTIELLVAGWNAKGYTPQMTLSIGKYGYKINEATKLELTKDELYLAYNYIYWLTSPSADYSFYVLRASGDDIDFGSYSYGAYVRPVVCLKSSIPATIGNGEYQFSLIK